MLFPAALLQYPQIDPVALQLGPLQVRWYGLAYVSGFLLAYGWLRVMVRRGMLRLTMAQLADLVGWLVVGVVIGGRAGWWLFYHRSIPGWPEPWYEPLAVWHGGMSFHGGLLGVLAVMFLWSRRQRVRPANLMDCAALVAPVGLFFGRLANFINGELVGRPTSLPWAMIFPNDPLPRHPSQLYEAFLEGPLLLGVLWLLWRTMPLVRRRNGVIASLFLLFYGLFRFMVEFTRQPDPQLGFIAFGWLTMGQLLSLAIALAGAVMAILAARHQEQPPAANATAAS